MPFAKSILTAMILAGLAGLGYLVLRQFMVPVIWAIILGYATWPIYRRVRLALGHRTVTSALLMTAILLVAFFAPVLWVSVAVSDDLTIAYKSAADWFNKPSLPLPPAVLRIPMFGSWLNETLNEFVVTPALIQRALADYGGDSLSFAARVLGDVGRNAMKFGFAMITVFFVYLHGEVIAAQVNGILARLFGTGVQRYVNAIGETTKGITYGLLLTALAQGLLAGAGYWVAGVPAAALLGAMTMLMAFVPYGAAVVWIPVVMWLFASGQIWAGVGLLVWAAAIVSSIDNIVRPLAISSSTRLPFLLVLFGVLGGLNAFGLIDCSLVPPCSPWC
jgi:predicted PurR-regulated permease PerM